MRGRKKAREKQPAFARIRVCKTNVLENKNREKQNAANDSA